jgi:alkaline phosphatase
MDHVRLNQVTLEITLLIILISTAYDLHFANAHRVDPKSFDLSPLNFKFPATVPLKSETHAGEDVGIWAVGASSHLFRGSMEQNVIAHILAYAACIGDGLKACDK